MEKQILYNVLNSIKRKESITERIVPNSAYLKSLENIGLVKLGWENQLTDLGRYILSTLEPFFIKY